MKMTMRVLADNDGLRPNPRRDTYRSYRWVGGDQGDTYMTPGMLQNHATRAFSAYQALGGPDMATRVVDIALGWLHNIDQS